MRGDSGNRARSQCEVSRTVGQGIRGRDRRAGVIPSVGLPRSAMASLDSRSRERVNGVIPSFDFEDTPLSTGLAWYAQAMEEAMPWADFGIVSKKFAAEATGRCSPARLVAAIEDEIKGNYTYA